LTEAARDGAAVVVWRRAETGIEWLVLHRAVFEPEFAGDWAWGPPGGGCHSDELPAECARRELEEETGISAECRPTPCGNQLADVFHAEVAADAEIVLTFEHDAYRWLPLDEARALCLPAYVGDQLACVAALIAER
jgi:8-oxo-dGTP pyrophosphatase MutT (NUDIX family)